MSLHTLANHVQDAGRGKDTVLVHMTPNEVGGLQALAKAHGGSLTTNPETGLPEAGFLEAILPMAAGFFLGPAGLGIAQSALGASAMVGGATALATGSLSKGLMAGFGAYGGFGLAEGLAGAGAAAGATNAANASNAAAQATAKSQLGQLAATGPATAIPSAAANTGANAVTSFTGTGSFGAAPVANLNQQLIQGSGYTMAAPTATQVALKAPVSVFQGGTGTAAELTKNAAAAQQAAAPVTNWNNVKAGFSDVTSSGDKAWNFIKKNPTPFVTAGIGLASDLMGNKSGAAAPASGPSYLRPYEFSTEQNPDAYLASSSSAERDYFKNPRYKALPIQQLAASGGLLGMAVGGPVEEMSAENAVGGNMMYPQSQLKTDMYSNPMMQRPMPTNVIHSGIDAPVGAYTGEPRFAEGGSTESKYSYDPATMKYTQTTSAAPTASKLSGNPFVDGLFGLFGAGPYGNGVRMGGIGMGGGVRIPVNTVGQQPTVTTETSGGMMAPAVQAQPQAQPQAQQANPIVPNIQLQPQRTPEQQLGLEGFYDMMDAQLAKKGAQMQGMAGGGMAGMSHLGGYSDGGRLLRGPGDGVSDSIPASIGNRQPARLADGEFVVPARIVSEIGNGSTEAGARKLYAMMDRVQKARRKTVGKGKVAVNSKSERFLPA